MYFYDTCALLNMGEMAFDEPFMISCRTLIELEQIKTDKHKDEQVKHKVRVVSRLLNDNAHSNTVTIIYTGDFRQDENFLCRDYLMDSPDSHICYAAWQSYINDNNTIFCTDDLCCKNIASAILNIPVCSSEDIIYADMFITQEKTHGL